MKILSVLIILFVNLSLCAADIDLVDTRYIPRWIKTNIFQDEVINGVTDEADRDLIISYYFSDGVGYNYYLRVDKSNEQSLLYLYAVMLKHTSTRGIISTEAAKVEHENNYPVFSQKGGMLYPGDHSFYFRTDDEWTGFSTIFLGYRYAVNEYFNIAIEGGVGLPQIYLADIILHFKLYESVDRFFFLGIRARLGYVYQNTEEFMFVDGGYMGFGDDYYTIKNRHGLYFAADLTAAFRFGRYKSQNIYYTIFPKLNIDLVTGDLDVLFCPVMVGYEVRWGLKMEWSFAVEAGYTFPIPWGSVPAGEWINFPSLANVSVNYRFGGDDFY